MAAAMRSALAMLGRRACITAPPRMPPLRQAAARNIEGSQWYSNESFRMTDKKKWLVMKDNLEMILSTSSKWSREALKTLREGEHQLYLLAVSGLGIYSIPVMAEMWRLRDEPDEMWHLGDDERDKKDGGKKFWRLW